jgi:hypothetical protein
MEGRGMPEFCITWRQPTYRLWIVVIVVVIYSSAYRYTLVETTPMVLGGLLSRLMMATEPACSMEKFETEERY